MQAVTAHHRSPEGERRGGGGGGGGGGRRKKEEALDGLPEIRSFVNREVGLGSHCLSRSFPPSLISRTIYVDVQAA